MKAIVSGKHRKLVMPWRDDVANIIEDVRRISHNQRDLAVVPHLPRETKLLRNLGIDVPSPILSQYQWPRKPFESQRVSAALYVTEPRVYDTSDMGTGKTSKTLYSFDYLRQVHVARRMLVIAPLSTLVSVWDSEIFAVFPHLTAAVLHGTRKQRLKYLATNPDICIINHDGVETIVRELIGWKPDIVVIDELAAYRNANTNRWDAADKLINNPRRSVPFVWGLTGRPTPNAPTDCYGQVKLLHPGRVPRSTVAFRSQLMLNVSKFKWVPKPDAYDQVHKLMQPAVRFTLDQCHDLPPTIYSSRLVDMHPEQKKFYDQLMRSGLVWYKGGKVQAVNEGALLTKLLQISAGFVYDTNHVVRFVGAKERLRLVLDLIAEANKKVLVFSTFKASCHILHKLIQRVYSVALITGETPKSERDRTIAAFRRSTHPHVIVAHEKTMAHGLTLVEADTIIWAGPTLSSEAYDQGNARIRRPGQTDHTRVVNMYSSEVERRAFQRLQRRQKLQGMLLAMFEEMNLNEEGD